MFLEFAAEYNASRIVVCDTSLRQLLYADYVVSLIKGHTIYSDWLETLHTLEAKRCYLDAPVYCDNKGYRWYNLVKTGYWRGCIEKMYNTDFCFWHGPIREAPIPRDSVVYTSTLRLEEWPKDESLTVIEAYTDRNEPKLWQR